jgi:hypothetical protein
MFQYQIYPSGAVSNYRTIVNNVSGVTAILDHSMGIIEYSLSGVAFYIKAISDYINQNSVGTTTLPITSGYFNHIGFTWYGMDDTSMPFVISTDGIISGVNVIHSSGVSIYDTSPDIKSLVSSSGQFNNVMFDDGFKGSCVIKDFIFTDLRNLYSGYVPANPKNRLASSQVPIVTELDYPFDLGASGVLNDLSIRNRLTKSLYEYGMLQGVLTVDRLYVNNLTGIQISGNLSIQGLFKPDLSGYSSTVPAFCESLFQMKSHRHDGVNSNRLDASKFNSVHPIQTHFSIVQSSGNIKVNGEYRGNNIGLSCGWEVVDLPDVDNIQKLLTCKDRMYALDNTKLVELDTGNILQTTLTEYPRAQVIATKTGDTPALIEVISGKNRNLSNTSDVVSMRITPFNTGKASNILSILWIWC